MGRQTAAVGYVRVSGKGQVEGHGFDRQEEDLRAFAKGQYDLQRVYQEAHTGTEAERPVFSEMVSDLLANGCRTILVASLDRFARDLSVQMQLLALLKARGLKLVSVATGQDVTQALDEDPMLKAMVQVQGVFAELDKGLVVKKLRRAREAIRSSEGRCEGRKRFGYYPGEEKSLEAMFRLRSKRHLSYRGVANELNSQGLLTRYGKAWNPGSVKRILDRGRRPAVRGTTTVQASA